MTNVDIDVKESFPHLKRAPIVEAVLDLRARASAQLEKKALKSKLEGSLTGYLFLDSLREYRGELKVKKGTSPVQNVEDLGWKGLRFRSEDKCHIVQYNRNGFVFSRLYPYVDWRHFQEEALRLWQIFNELAKPLEFQRIGLRFINRIRLPLNEPKFQDYLYADLKPPLDLDLPFQGFMHQDTLSVPGHPYAVKLTRTIQPAATDPDNRLALILDIDVFTTQPLKIELDSLNLWLNEMRWLKNKVFFGTIKEQVLQSLK